MTEEQKAEEYTNNLLKDVTCNIGHPRARHINSIDIQDAWLAGYRECEKEWQKKADYLKGKKEVDSDSPKNI